MPGGFKASPLTDDWVSRLNLVDMYPRKSDPFVGPNAQTPLTAPPASLGDPMNQGIPGAGAVDDIYSGWLTSPGPRPVVYQRAFNSQLTPGALALPTVPLTSQQFQCDSMVIAVPSTAANSVFFGYGSQITTGSGLEVQPGLPIIIEPENTRELWELQRMLEVIAAMVAAERGWNPLGPYRAPRVAFNANEYYLTAAAPTPMSIMLFFIPEMQ